MMDRNPVCWHWAGALLAALAVCLPGVLVPSYCVHATDLARGNDQGNDPLFEVHTATGKVHTGKITEIGNEWSILLSTNAKLIPGRTIVDVLQKSNRVPEFPREAQIVLTSGDRIALDPECEIVFGDRLLVTPARPLQLTSEKNLALPLSLVQLLWLQSPDNVVDRERAIRELLSLQRKHDLVLLSNGDRLSGVITKFATGKPCSIKDGKRTIDIPFERIAAIAFNTYLLRQPRIKGPFARLILANGTRLSAQTVVKQATSATLKARTAYGAEVRFTANDLASLQIHDGPAVYLSDLEPSAHKQTPFFDLSWPFRNDSNFLGQPIRIAGQTYDKGLGTHTGCTLSYQLDGKFDWFEATVGLNKDGNRLGSAIVSVLVDGKLAEKGSKCELHPGRPMCEMRVAVGGAKTLTLVSEFGSFGNVLGRVNWGNARLIRLPQ